MLRLFPLQLVLMPGEKLNLHVFEDRYKQLLNECLEADEPFGIPFFINDKVKKIGAAVSVEEVVNRGKDGRADIRVVTEAIFRLQSFQNPQPGKLYPAGEAELIHYEHDAGKEERMLLLEESKDFFESVNLEMPEFTEDENLSFALASKGLGLSDEQKCDFLSLSREKMRMAFLMKHLSKAIPMMREIRNMKKLAALNGHFRHFDPLNF